MFCGGDRLGHGEEAVTKETVVGAQLHQLHEVIAAHLGVVDMSLQRLTRVICKPTATITDAEIPTLQYWYVVLTVLQYREVLLYEFWNMM